ncbi:TetR/AcrR family transcriptional regulator [Verticiella sediminum]|nr:TetR/AcrR family transcriptional regulator [Verticiella sediminum]
MRTRERAPERAGPYHHGDLHHALVQATESILAERGVEGFTLREAARRAGVTAAAPAHHFGSAAGLLTEVALLGFAELQRFLAESGADSAASPAERVQALGLAYVRFALAYPARFQLMFREDRLIAGDARLAAAGDAAYAELERAGRAYFRLAPDAPLDAGTSAALLGAWSTVHGFAHLALDHRFERFIPDAHDVAALARTLRMILARFFP